MDPAARAILLALIPAVLPLPGDGPGAAPKGDRPKEERPKEERPKDPAPAKTPPGREGTAPDGKKGGPAAGPKASPPGTPSPPPAEAPSRAAPAPRSKREALRLLERFRVSVDFDARPLREAVAYLSAVSGVNILPGPALLADGGADAPAVTLRLKDVTARQALEILADGNDLGIGFASGVLLVTTRREARGKPILRLHALGDLLLPLTDFPAPDLVLRPAGEEKAVEPETPRKPAFGDVDEVIDLVKRTVGEGTWEEEGVSISSFGEFLAVKQYGDVQEEVGRLLALLRSAR